MAVVGYSEKDFRGYLDKSAGNLIGAAQGAFVTGQAGDLEDGKTAPLPSGSLQADVESIETVDGVAEAVWCDQTTAAEVQSPVLICCEKNMK